VSESAATWHEAYIGLGSNLGGPARQLRLALERLGDLEAVAIDGVSGLYRSEPLGGIEQPAFLNGVVGVRTALAPAALLAALKTIEAALGRKETAVRWGPRKIDLDLLVFDDVRLDAPDLVIPHPGIGGRNFVLLPLRELAPDLAVPGLGRIADWPVPDEPAIERISDSPWQ